jgi:hypothetical protein
VLNWAPRRGAQRRTRQVYCSPCTAERCKENSRGLSEHRERYPRLRVTASFPRTPLGRLRIGRFKLSATLGVQVSPPKLGGVSEAVRKWRASSLAPKTGWFLNRNASGIQLWNHPAAAIRGSGFHLLSAAAAPPNLGGDTCTPSVADSLNLPIRSRPGKTLRHYPSGVPVL